MSAKDKATNKEQSIIIKASSGLSDDEVEAMVKDAEANAEDDRKLKELVETRNQAENMIHATEKSVKDLGEKVTDDEKSEIESRVADLREVLSGDDKDAIEAKLTALTESSGKLAERAYAQAGEEGAAPDDATAAGGEAPADDVVDAEFEEVKEDDKK